MSQNSGKALLNTVESVIQSDSQLLIKSLCNSTGPVPVACKGIYHATPLINGEPQYCCFYRKRPGQAGLQPDCPNIESNMAWYASLFVSNGVDVLIPDTTNLGKYPDPNSDLLNIRPVEVGCCSAWVCSTACLCAGQLGWHLVVSYHFTLGCR